MATTGLFGPHHLTNAGIDGAVRGVGPGAYALGTSDTAGNLTVRYVGRSDDDLNARLKQHLGKYQHFKYAFFPTAKAAFDKECALYHDFKPSDNAIHPARPQGSMLRCPVCGA
jgi:hypothetical protein